MYQLLECVYRAIVFACENSLLLCGVFDVFVVALLLNILETLSISGLVYFLTPFLQSRTSDFGAEVDLCYYIYFFAIRFKPENVPLTCFKLYGTINVDVTRKPIAVMWHRLACYMLVRLSDAANKTSRQLQLLVN